MVFGGAAPREIRHEGAERASAGRACERQRAARARAAPRRSGVTRTDRAAQPFLPELFTDLYELTMAASYFAHGLNGEATFDLFVRSLPEQRNFLVASGLHDVLAYLEE